MNSLKPTALLWVPIWLHLADCSQDLFSSSADQRPRRPAKLEALRVPWTFTIQDQTHKTVGTMTVRFTGDPASSCLAGHWRRVIVDAFESTGEPAFPGNDPLVYEVDGTRLTIGRNDWCDDYRMLAGELTASGLSGEYYFLGLSGQRQLGYVQGRPTP